MRLAARSVAVRCLSLLLVALMGGCNGENRNNEASPTTTLRVGAPTTTEARPSGPPAPTPLPEARTEVAGTSWRGRVVVAGGVRIDGTATDRVDVYDPVTGAWSAGPALPVPLHHLALAVLGDDLWAVGGYAARADNSWMAVRSTYRLAPGAKAWMTGPALTRGRGALGLASVDDRLVAFGGASSDGNVLLSVEVLASGADDWASGPSLAEPREHLGSMTFNSRVFAIAGRVGGLETNLSSVESWKPGEANWRREPNVDDPRGGTAASGGCVVGGEEPTSTIASVECLGPDRWRTTHRLREPRHGVAVVALRGYLHVIGGGPQPGLTVSTAHEVFAL